MKISLQKDLVSDTGAGEFAKKYRTRDLSTDLSPVSVRALMNFYHPYGLMALNLKYNIQRFSTLCRIGGAGFKVLSRLDHTRSVRYARMWSMYTKHLFNRENGELWLGRGSEGARLKGEGTPG